MAVFVALADPVRRQLLLQLAAGPLRVVDLAADHAISRPAISRHLRVLTGAGLVVAQERGRERHYRLIAEGFEPLERYLAAVRPSPGAMRIGEHVVDALDLEVRRTVRDHRHPQDPPRTTPLDVQEDTA